MSAGSEQELNDLERALGKLVPQPSNLVRDRILFAAGQMRGRRGNRLLAACVVILTGVSLFLSYQLWVRPLPAPQTRIVTVYANEPVVAETITPPAKKDLPESVELSMPAMPPVLPGEYPTAYGTIQRNIPHFGERALRTWPGFSPGDFKDDEPTRAGTRPGQSDSMLPWLPRR